MSHGDKLHDAGFKGQGMTIAVIDAGFHNMDRIKADAEHTRAGYKRFCQPRFGYLCRE